MFRVVTRYLSAVYGIFIGFSSRGMNASESAYSTCWTRLVSPLAQPAKILKKPCALRNAAMPEPQSQWPREPRCWSVSITVASDKEGNFPPQVMQTPPATTGQTVKRSNGQTAKRSNGPRSSFLGSRLLSQVEIVKRVHFDTAIAAGIEDFSRGRSRRAAPSGPLSLPRRVASAVALHHE